MNDRPDLSSMPEADDAMARYSRGDDAAFSELYDYLADRLYAYVLRKTRDVAQAEDLLQQIFLRIHRRRGHFIPGAQVSPWAFRIAENLTRDMWRQAQRRTHHAWRLESGGGSKPSRGDDVIEANETMSRLNDRLHQLPRSQRVAFELSCIEGLTLRETAQACGTTVAAIQTTHPPGENGDALGDRSR